MKNPKIFALTALCLTLGGWCAGAAASESETESLLREARRLESESRPREALEAYLRALQSHPDQFEALCAASYLYGQVGKRDLKLRKDYFTRSLELARRAVRIAPNHPEATFALAWAYGGIALISSAREKVELARKIKPLLDNTLEKNPKDDRAWYVLANWRYRIADATFVERAAAKLVAGGLPGAATFETAVKAYQEAVALKPDSILYRRELARALEKSGQPDLARDQYEEALRLPIKSEEDPMLLAHCRAALKRLGD